MSGDDDLDAGLVDAPVKSSRGMRTDRNNNPIAAAVPVGKTNQFTDALDRASIPWSYGDPFPKDATLSTIKIHGDPVEGARAILSGSNALKWYRNTTGKQILPKYGVRSQQDFSVLKPEQQNDIIRGIYQSEGGNGNLTRIQQVSDPDLDAGIVDIAQPQGRGAAMADNVSSGTQGGSTLTSNDAAWHFGMTPDEAKKLTPKALRVLTEAVQEDQRKKNEGQTVAPPPLKYQNEMRAKAGLKPLQFNLANADSGASPYYKPDAAAFSLNEKKPIEVRQPFTFNQPSDEQIKAGIQSQVASEAAQSQKSFQANPQGGGIAPQVDIQAETEKRFNDFKAERAKTLDYARLGPRVEARNDPTERASAAISDLLQKYAPGIASIDTPGGLKTDVLRGAISGLNVIPGPQAAILNRISQLRGITPEEKILNPTAETSANLARGVGQASTAFLPFVGAGKLVSSAGVASPVLRDMLTFGLAEAGKQLAQTGKIDPEALAETMATGGVMGKIAGVNPSLKRRLVAYIAPQLAASVAKGEKPDQILQSATQNALFALAGGHEAKEEAPIQTVPDLLQGQLRGGEINRSLAAREAAVSPPTQASEVPAMRVAGRVRDAQPQSVELPSTRYPETKYPESLGVVGPTKPVEGVEEGAKLNRWQHRDFGLVTESADQSGAGKGRVRVLAEDGTEHIIQRPKGTGAGNQIAVPVRIKPIDSRAADESAQAQENAPFKVIDRRGQDEQQSNMGVNTERDTGAGIRVPPERIDSGNRASERQDSSPQSLLPAEESTPPNRASATPEQAAKPQPIEAAQPIETKPSELKTDPYFTPEPSTTSAKKAQVDAERTARGAEPLPWSPKTKSDTELLDAAKKANANNPGDPRRLVDEVLAKPRALSDKETVQVDLRKQELKNEHSQLLKEIDKTSNPETLAVQRARLETIEKEFDDTDKAWRLSGTEKGRGLRAQQVTINQDFDLVSVLGRMKAAKGRELTIDERAKYEGMVKERDQAILDRDAALERAHTAELQRQINKSSRQRTRSETKEALDVEAATIRSNIAAEFARLKTEQGKGQYTSAFGLGSLDPEGVITKELIRYARNRVKANVGIKAEQLIDDAHELVKDFGASRRQVAELLSGYMKPRDTREVDPATKQLADIRKEIKSLLLKEDIAAGTMTEKAQGPSKRFVSRNTTRLKQLQAKEADLTARMAADDYNPRPKSQPLPYNREVNAAQMRVKQIERQFNEEAAKRAPKTIGDYLVRWKRFAVLGFPSTIGKLGSAATGRMAATPLYEIAGEGLRHVPGLKSTFEDVPRSTLAGERAAISQLWQSESFKDMLRHLKGGDDMISLLYGEGGGDEFVQRSSSGKSLIPKNFDELMDRPGHIHAAIKVIPKRAAIFRTFENLLRTEQNKPNGRDVSDPAVQLALMGEAYPEAQRAVLQQKNPMSSLFNRVIHAASTSDSRMARGVGKALQFQYPITKVPVNFVGETALHIGGLPVGLGEVAVRGASAKVKQLLGERGETMQKIASKLPDAVSDLKPEERVRIARALKTGSVGLGFVIWGMMRPDQFGGYYQPGKRDSKDVKAGGMRFMGVNVPRWMGHIPPLEAAQFGATLRRVYDSMSEKGLSKTDAAKEAGIAGTKGMAEEVPFIDPLINSAHGVGALVGKEGERTKFLGNEAVAMVPGSLRQGAKTLDYPKGGTLTGALNPFGSQEPVSREEKTIGEIVKGGIPVLRQTVPEKNSSGKLLESRGGDDPLSKELMRLGKQVNGASKDKDETQVQFEKRRDYVNKEIEADLKSLIDSRKYKQLSEPDKKQQITMHLMNVTRQSNENYRLQNNLSKPPALRQVYIESPRTVSP